MELLEEYKDLPEAERQEKARREAIPPKDFYLNIFKELEAGSLPPKMVKARRREHRHRFGALSGQMLGHISRMSNGKYSKWGQ